MFWKDAPLTPTHDIITITFTTTPHLSQHHIHSLLFKIEIENNNFYKTS